MRTANLTGVNYMVLKIFLTVSTAIILGGPFANAGTLEDTKAAGVIKCGVSQGLPGFSSPDDLGNWSGLDVSFCRAVAAAVLSDPDKVEFIPLSSKVRFTALQSGEIDILSRNTTWTLTRDSSLGMEFVGVDFYDGQGFMVRKDLGGEKCYRVEWCHHLH